MDINEDEKDSENEESGSSDNWGETFEEGEFKEFGKIESNFNKTVKLKWRLKSLCKVIQMIFIKRF